MPKPRVVYRPENGTHPHVVLIQPTNGTPGPLWFAFRSLERALDRAPKLMVEACKAGIVEAPRV